MRFLIIFTVIISVCLGSLFIACQTTPQKSYEEEWIGLFDGSNFEDWTPKFKGYELGVNYRNQFALEDSLLMIRYQPTDSFTGTFGHLFYKEKFSHYRLKVKYRFIGDQMTGGPAWAFRNNGLMLHSQKPQSMGKDQDFPISLEVQLLGGDGINARPNANLCTPRN